MNQQGDPFSKWKKQTNLTNPTQAIPEIIPTDQSPIKQLQPNQIQSQQTEQKKPNSFSKWKKEYPFEGENDLEREIERNQAQFTSRIGETILGLPGDLYSFTKSIFGGNPETNLPTSKSLRETSESLSQGYTKPQNEGEERTGEVIQDIASFMLPGAGKYNLVRNLGIPIVANLAKEGIKYTGNEKLGDAAKIGTMVVLDLMNLKGGGAKKFAGELFNESEKLIPEGAILKSSSFEKSLNQLEKNLSSGGSAPSTEKALKKVNEIQSKMKNGEIEIRELIDFRKNINEIKSELGGYEVQMPKHIKKKAIANLDNVKGNVIKALDEYGSKTNPEFGKMNKSANEAWGAYENSDKIANFIKKTAGKYVKSTPVKALLGLAAGGTMMKYSLATKAGAGAIPLLAGYESYKVLSQVMNSPTLRKFYGNILKGAASGNASQVSRNVKALEENIENENPSP